MTKTDTKSQINLKPAPGYMVILPLEAQTKTDSGIYLPDTAGEKPQKGEVLVVGAEDECECACGKCHKKAFAKKDDIVIYKEWMSNKVKINGVEYLFAKFEDILGVEER